uniref:Uncharacterized protein n=1 Tax=Amphimedon queenslandica TaxID=400682 RepID=A0A1X7UZT7_AMPQE
MLVAFLAENLASHAVGCSKLSMSFARQMFMCGTKEACQIFLAENFVLRTPEQHEVRSDEQFINAQKKSKEYDINDNSFFSDVNGFSVIQGYATMSCMT